MSDVSTPAFRERLKIISFLCAIYNSEQWIDKLIESIPTDYAYEILFCDDCSTDRILEKLIEWQKKISKCDDDIKYRVT